MVAVHGLRISAATRTRKVKRKKTGSSPPAQFQFGKLRTKKLLAVTFVLDMTLFGVTLRAISARFLAHAFCDSSSAWLIFRTAPKVRDVGVRFQVS